MTTHADLGRLPRRHARSAPPARPRPAWPVMASLAVLAIGCADAPVASTPATSPAPITQPTTGTPSPRSNNAADVSFVREAVDHLRAGTGVADRAARRASSPEVRALAQSIGSSQTARLTRLSRWAEEWTARPEGTGQAETRASGTEQLADGADLDRAFIDEMLTHHRQGVTLAEEERERGADPRALGEAGKMIDDLIVEMTALENARLTLDGWRAG